jgi:hypothetical protein
MDLPPGPSIAPSRGAERVSAVLGVVMADVTIDVGDGQTVVTSIPCGSADRVGMSEG